MIRAATAEDAGEISAIYNHYVEHTVVTFEEDHITATEMRRRLGASAGRHPWFVAEVVGTLTGYAYAAPWHPRAAYRHAVETTVYVDPGHLRRGVGKALYGALLDELRRADFRCAVAVIALPNAASVALHEKMGFTKAGHLKSIGYKFERWIDVGHWQLLL